MAAGHSIAAMPIDANKSAASALNLRAEKYSERAFAWHAKGSGRVVRTTGYNRHEL
jgi:hypothetical protein